MKYELAFLEFSCDTIVQSELGSKCMFPRSSMCDHPIRVSNLVYKVGNKAIDFEANGKTFKNVPISGITIFTSTISPKSVDKFADHIREQVPYQSGKTTVADAFTECFGKELKMSEVQFLKQCELWG